jgi:hypothetical protein
MTRFHKKRRKSSGFGLSADAELLAEFHDSVEQEDLLSALYGRAAWSFHRAPAPFYTQQGSVAASLAYFRARDWFLFEFKMPEDDTSPTALWLESLSTRRRSRLLPAYRRFSRSRSGLFLVRHAADDESLELQPLDQEVLLTARLIPAEGVFAPLARERPFAEGDMVVAQLYRLDDRLWALSPGADVVPEFARDVVSSLRAPGSMMRSAADFEAVMGASPLWMITTVGSRLLCEMADSFLRVTSGYSFDMSRLRTELRGEASPHGVMAQLASEVDPWTLYETELLLWLTALQWMATHQPAEGQPLSQTEPERIVSKVKRHIERALADIETPGVPVAREPALLLTPFDVRRARELPSSPALEWIADVRPLRLPVKEAGQVPTYPTVCVVVEHAAPDEGYGSEPWTSGELDEEDPDDLDDNSLEGSDDAWLGEAARESDHEEEWPVDEGDPRVLGLRLAERGREAESLLHQIVSSIVDPQYGEPRRPARILFRRRELAARLKPAVDALGIEAGIRYVSPEFEEAFEDEESDTAEASWIERFGALRYTSLPGSTEEKVGRFFSSAAAFYRSLSAKKVPPDETPLTVSLKGRAPVTYTAYSEVEQRTTSLTVVLIPFDPEVEVRVFFDRSDWQAAVRLAEEGEEDRIDDYDSIEVGFLPRKEVEPDARQEIQRAGWELPSSAVYPYGARNRPGYPPRLICGEELELVGCLLRALVAFVESHERDADGWDSDFSTRFDAGETGELVVSWHASDVED